MGVNCCVPGCSWHSKKAKAAGTIRHFFKIRRPGLARTVEEKTHRQTLRKFILSLRDPTKGDTIKKQLHKESAAICDVHFDEKDILKKGSKPSLKIGAVPIYNLPNKMQRRSTPRKPPAVRVEPKPPFRALTQCCVVPGCPLNNWCRRGEKALPSDRSLFKVRWPETAKSEEEKLHRLELRKFVLSVRDATKDKKILDMLHKENAAICSCHFRDDDILCTGSVRKLRLGAIPCVNIPRPHRQSTQPPTEDLELIKAVKSHPCLFDASRARHRYKPVRRKSWLAVSVATKLSVKACRARWKCLRDEYEKKRNAYKRFGYPKYVTKESQLMLLLNYLDPFCESVSTSSRLKPLAKALPTETSIRAICEQLSTPNASERPIVAVEITDSDMVNCEEQNQASTSDSFAQARPPAINDSHLQGLGCDQAVSDNSLDEECDEPQIIMSVKKEVSEIMDGATDSLSMHDDLIPPSIWNGEVLPYDFEDSKDADELFLRNLLPILRSLPKEAKLRLKANVISFLRDENRNIDLLTNCLPS